MIIPVYQGDLDAAVQEECFTYLGIQTKLQKNKTTPRWKITLRKDLALRPGEDKMDLVETISCNVWGPPLLDSINEGH